MALKVSAQYPVLEEYRQLRKFMTLAKSQFRFPVGVDGRNRTQARPFSAKTSRSQPSTAENIPNATKALRSLLKPPQGQVLIHRDWANAEYGIASALSQDDKRWYNYQHRDCYLVKAADFGYCDYSATDATHHDLRNKFKPVTLAGQYGQTPQGLADTLGISKQQAKMYQDREIALYPKYQAWLAHNSEDIAFNRFVDTEFGWRLWLPRKLTGHLTRSAMNHPVQGNGAEIMRLAACLMRATGDSWRVVSQQLGIGIGTACRASKASSLSAAASRLSSSVPSACARPPHAGSTALSGSPSSDTRADYQPRESTDGRRRRRPQPSSPAKPCLRL